MNKFGLGTLSPDQLSISVGGMTVRERVSKGTNIGLSLLRDAVGLGVSIFSMVFGTSTNIDLATFANISNKLKVPKRFQRKFVKDVPGQQSIMKAILKGQLQNPLYFSLVRDIDILEIVDGQQRWVTLKNFVNNVYSLGVGTIVTGWNGMSVDLSGLTYKQIIEELPNGEMLMEKLFGELKLPVVIYEGTEQEIRQLFIDLNSGATGLNKIEILLAEKSDTYDWVRGMNDEYDWDSRGIGTLRYTASEQILKWFYIFLHGPNKVNLPKMRTLVGEKIPSGFKTIIKQVGEMIESIPDKCGKSEFGLGKVRAFVWFMIDLSKLYNVKITDNKKFFKFVNKMFHDVTKKMGTMDKGTKKVYVFLDLLRFDDSETITAVTNELNHYFDMKLGELDGEFTKFNDEYGVQLRQVERNVNKSQMYEVLLNQDCKCPICGETVHLQDDAHHIEEYQYGGENEVENIVILHNECHKKVHHDDEVSLNEEPIEEDEDA